MILFWLDAACLSWLLHAIACVPLLVLVFACVCLWSVVFACVCLFKWLRVVFVVLAIVVVLLKCKSYPKGKLLIQVAPGSHTREFVGFSNGSLGSWFLMDAACLGYMMLGIVCFALLVLVFACVL